MLPSLALAGSLALHTSAPAHAAQRSLAQPRDLRPAARRRHATVLAATEAATVLVETGMPELPNGERITLELASFDVVGTGSHVWPSAKALCRWQDYAANQIAGTRVLELGAGTGAVGLFAAALGAQEVVLTDGLSGALPLLRRNIARNQQHLAAAGCAVARAEQLLWGRGQPLPSGHFDWVLGSDLAYHGTSAPLAPRSRCK
eukprot:Transcript_5616.p2 GENE.Transcript_5616~~Transcript_5616.p2  ORF type:complete len:224 (-),score=30.85 Transcript_5616:643-1251(-)